MSVSGLQIIKIDVGDLNVNFMCSFPKRPTTDFVGFLIYRLKNNLKSFLEFNQPEHTICRDPRTTEYYSEILDKNIFSPKKVDSFEMRSRLIVHGKDYKSSQKRQQLRFLCYSQITAAAAAYFCQFIEASSLECFFRSFESTLQFLQIKFSACTILFPTRHS